MTHSKSARYCRSCGYTLRDLRRAVCPECGKSFDRTDPRTTASHPAGDVLGGLAPTARMLTLVIGIGACATVVASAIGVDPLILWFGGVISIPFMFVLLVLVAIPRLPLRARTRVVAVAGVGLLLGTVLTGWPFRISFALHRPAMERLVQRVRSGTPTVGSGPTSVGVLTVTRIRTTPEGNVGLQLTGGTGGGTFLVHRAPGSTWTWYNLNWEHDLGHGWAWVDQD